MSYNIVHNEDAGDRQVQSVSFEEIDRLYVKRYTDTLNNMVSDADPLIRLNCALRDNNPKKAAAIEERMPRNLNYSIEDVSDKIVNKSHMRLAFLAAYTEQPKKALNFYRLCDQAAAQGHDVLLFSHASLPKEISCRANFFLAHPESSLCGIVPNVDAVIAENWSLAAEAMRISAPLKFFFADYSLMKYPYLEPELKSAVQKAYSLPMRILTFSNVLADMARQLFKREAAVLPIPANPNAKLAAGKGRAASNAVRVLIAANRDDASIYQEALSAMDYLKSNGIKFHVTGVFSDDPVWNYKYDFEIEEHALPPEQQMLELMKNTDVYLDLCSDDYLSYQIISAMANGCTVVLPKGAGAILGLINGENCIMFDSIKPPGLANALQKIAEEQDFRLFIGKNGQNIVRMHSKKALDKRLSKELGATVWQAVWNSRPRSD